MADDIAGQLLGREDRSSWCGDVDPTDRFVCQRIRDHALDLHACRNDAGGIHQWKAGPAAGGRGNMPAAIPATDPADDPIGTVRIAHWGGGHSVWQHTGGTPGNEWMCVWSTRHGNEGCTMRPEDVAGFPIAGAVPGTPGAASVGDGAGRLVDALLSGLETAWRDADDLRSSREAWALEADRLDVIATAAEYHTGPEECCDSECEHLHDEDGNLIETEGEGCPHVEMRHATAEDAIAAGNVPWLEAERERLLTICGKGGDFELDIAEALGVPAGTSNDDLIAALERLTRERDEARAAVADIDAHATPMGLLHNDDPDGSPHHYVVTVGALHRALGKAYTAEKCDHERERLRAEVDQLTNALSVANATLVTERQEAASRPAIPADAARYLMGAVSASRVQGWPDDKLHAEFDNLLSAWSAPVSGSDTTADGEDR